MGILLAFTGRIDVMNTYMESYITSSITYLKTFKQSLRMAAMRNDGRIDRQEQKIIDKVDKLTDKYIRELEKLTDDD